MRKVLFFVLIVGVVLGGVAGWALRGPGTTTVWKTGPAHVSMQGHEASIVMGDWTYGINGPVSWIQKVGGVTDVGWPACLTDGATVRFLTTSAVLQPLGQKPVLEVDCS